MSTKQVKVIHIAAYYDEDAIKACRHHPAEDSEDYYFASWGALMARRIASHYPWIDVEVWNTKSDIAHNTCAEKYGIKSIIFKLTRPYLNKLLTFEMLFLLKKYSKSFELILHTHGIHNSLNYYLPMLVPHARIIAQHHGDYPPEEKTLKQGLKRIIEKIAFPRMHAITYCTEKERTYLSSKTASDRLFFMPVGADYEAIQPLDKTQCRQELGLDINKIYGLYVGRFYTLKGVDLMLNSYNALKQKYNMEIIFVGGENDNSNNLYGSVASSGCPYFITQPWDRMPVFYGASDFLLHSGFRYNGFDVACLESLAANRPVLSSYFNFIPYDYSEWGIALKSEETFIEATEQMILTYEKFQKCRETSYSYFSKKAIIDTIVNTIYKLTNPHVFVRSEAT